jgi:hypothetical protein
LRHSSIVRQIRHGVPVRVVAAITGLFRRSIPSASSDIEVLFRQGDRAIFAFGFAKSAQENISKADLALLRDAAAEALRWTQEELDRLVASGALTEIKDGEDDEE